MPWRRAVSETPGPCDHQGWGPFRMPHSGGVAAATGTKRRDVMLTCRATMGVGDVSVLDRRIYVLSDDGDTPEVILSGSTGPVTLHAEGWMRLNPCSRRTGRVRTVLRLPCRRCCRGLARTSQGGCWGHCWASPSCRQFRSHRGPLHRESVTQTVRSGRASTTYSRSRPTAGAFVQGQLARRASDRVSDGKHRQTALKYMRIPRIRLPEVSVAVRPCRRTQASVQHLLSSEPVSQVALKTTDRYQVLWSPRILVWCAGKRWQHSCRHRREMCGGWSRKICRALEPHNA
jgi:hypothetical protein